MSSFNIGRELALYDFVIPDPGDAGIISTKGKNFGICHIVSAAAETRKVGTPERAGIWLILHMKTDGGTVTVTGEGSEEFDQAANTDFDFDTVNDVVVLVSVIGDKEGTARWATILDDGTA